MNKTFEFEKSYKVPQETQERLVRIKALRVLVDKAIASYWGEKRALKYQFKIEVLSSEIRMVLRKLYPKEYESSMSYSWVRVSDNTIEVQFE